MDTFADKRTLGLPKKKRYKNDILYLRSKVIQIRAYIFLVLVVIASSGFSQIANDSVTTHKKSKPSVLCLGAGIGCGNQFSIGVSLDILGERSYSQKVRPGVSLCIKNFFFKPLNEPPADYKPSIFDSHFQSSTMISAMFAVETLTGQGHIGFGFALGPAYNSTNEIIYTYVPKSGWLAAHYDKDYNRISKIGLLMNIKIKFRFPENFGLEVGPFLNVNSYKSLAGIQLNLLARFDKTERDR